MEDFKLYYSDSSIKNQKGSTPFLSERSGSKLEITSKPEVTVPSIRGKVYYIRSHELLKVMLDVPQSSVLHTAGCNSKVDREIHLGSCIQCASLMKGMNTEYSRVEGCECECVCAYSWVEGYVCE